MSYESRYLRAVDPDRPRAVWVRHTTTAGIPSLWITLFGEDGVYAFKRRRSESFGERTVSGPEYDLRWEVLDGEPLRHLPAAWMYRAPLPRTKLTTPVPRLALSGTVNADGKAFELDRWPGMLGHNWGAEHAERWIWLHGVFAGDAWLDLAVGRVKVGPVTTPWIVNGVVATGGERRRIGGRAHVTETPEHLELRAGGLRLTADSPRERIVVWPYAGTHHAANCSVAAIEATVDGRTLRTAHGGAYELGTRERPDGLPVQPFDDP
jgi:hypothetical protein